MLKKPFFFKLKQVTSLFQNGPRCALCVCFVIGFPRALCVCVHWEEACVVRCWGWRVSVKETSNRTALRFQFRVSVGLFLLCWRIPGLAQRWGSSLSKPTAGSSSLLIDNPLHNWKKVCTYFMCCLTHFSEKCVKMKPKYRLSAQRHWLADSGMWYRWTENGLGWHLIIKVDLLFISTTLAFQARQLFV